MKINNLPKCRVNLYIYSCTYLSKNLELVQNEATSHIHAIIPFSKETNYLAWVLIRISRKLKISSPNI